MTRYVLTHSICCLMATRFISYRVFSETKTYRIYEVNISSNRSLHIDLKQTESKLFSLSKKRTEKFSTPKCLKKELTARIIEIIPAPQK